jgi:hypothetical protein
VVKVRTKLALLKGKKTTCAAAEELALSAKAVHNRTTPQVENEEADETEVEEVDEEVVVDEEETEVEDTEGDETEEVEETDEV